MSQRPVLSWRTLVLALAVSLGSAATASATTFIVDASFAPGQPCTPANPLCNTIQQAVNAASPGDTVQVAPGTYNESVTVTKSLTLRGNQANVCAKDPMPFDLTPSDNPRPGGESIIEPPSGTPGIWIQANNVTVDGFFIRNASNRGGVETRGTESGHRIINNIFTGNTIGLYLNSSGATQSVVGCNAFVNNNNAGSAAGSGIYSDQGIKNALIDNNTFFNDQNVAIGLNGPLPPTFNSQDVQITNNDSIQSGSIFINNVDNVVIAKNRIVAALNNGVELAGGADNANINNNLIKGSQWSGIRLSLSGGITTDANISPVINDNTIIWNGRASDRCTFDYAGIKASDGAIDSPSQLVDAQRNRIAYNFKGVINLDVNDTIDARLSWWGSSTGPMEPTNPGGLGDKIEGLVLFIPFQNLTDVPQGAFARREIEALYSNGITAGCTAPNPATGAVQFCPGNSVTRWQMAIFMERANRGANFMPMGIPQQFADVPPGSPGDQFVNQFFLDGFTGGCVAGASPAQRFFCPNDNVLRSQMAIFLLRAEHGAGYMPPAATGQVFMDVPANSFAAGYIEQLFFEGITAGCVAGANAQTRKFCPSDAVTRAQMAIFLVRTFKDPNDPIRFLVTENDRPSPIC